MTRCSVYRTTKLEYVTIYMVASLSNLCNGWQVVSSWLTDLRDSEAFA